MKYTEVSLDSQPMPFAKGRSVSNNPKISFSNDLILAKQKKPLFCVVTNRFGRALRLQVIATVFLLQPTSPKIRRRKKESLENVKQY